MSANKDRLALIEHLSAIGGEHSEDLRETLDEVVSAIAAGMEAEVCSLYLFDPQRERVVLRATVGLDRESVGKVSMRISEGLVGLVLQKNEPVYVPDAISHPRYKYFPETGEERYHTFLGVPILDGHKKPLGVLVAQTLERRKFNKGEIRLLATAANQVAQILSHFRLRESLATKDLRKSAVRLVTLRRRKSAARDSPGWPPRLDSRWDTRTWSVLFCAASTAIRSPATPGPKVSASKTRSPARSLSWRRCGRGWNR